MKKNYLLVAPAFAILILFGLPCSRAQNTWTQKADSEELSAVMLLVSASAAWVISERE